MRSKLVTLSALSLAPLLALSACGSDTDTSSDDAIACGYLLKAHDGTMNGAKEAMQTIAYFDDKVEDPDIKDKWVQARDDGAFLQFNPGVEYDMWYVQLTTLVDLCEDAGHEARD